MQYLPKILNNLSMKLGPVVESDFEQPSFFNYCQSIIPPEKQRLLGQQLRIDFTIGVIVHDYENREESDIMNYASEKLVYELYGEMKAELSRLITDINYGGHSRDQIVERLDGVINSMGGES